MNIKISVVIGICLRSSKRKGMCLLIHFALFLAEHCMGRVTLRDVFDAVV